MMNSRDIKIWLDEKAFYHNRPEFIETDPIQIPHQFDDPEDIAISAFLTAILSWGNRKTTISKAQRLMTLLENAPHDFILHAGQEDLRTFRTFVHRTFNGSDCEYFIMSLRHLYRDHGGLHTVFTRAWEESKNIRACLGIFRHIFLGHTDPGRAARHLPDACSGSPAKRINMFLRWMVRRDDSGVDFGLWKDIPPSALMIPLDIHSSEAGRKLGLLQRRQNDWKAVEELTAALRVFDPDDPVKYDFALFGQGVSEKS